MIRNLVGISQHLPQNHIMIQPYFPENVEFVQGSIHTEYGEVVAKWEQIQADKYKMSVTLPYGLDYTIRQYAKYHVVTEVTDLHDTHRLIDIIYETIH
ncbi:Bacterial alpha-L-rhamnosidase [compost metagenome]